MALASPSIPTRPSQSIIFESQGQLVAVGLVIHRPPPGLRIITDPPEQVPSSLSARSLQIFAFNITSLKMIFSYAGDLCPEEEPMGSYLSSKDKTILMTSREILREDKENAALTLARALRINVRHVLLNLKSKGQSFLHP